MNAIKKPRILLVDDEPEILMAVQDELVDKTNLSPEQITVARSGNSAITFLKEMPKFDLIISDYRMDDGNGVKLLQYVIENNLIIPFAFYTSSTGFEFPKMKENFLGIFDKTDLENLIKKIQAYTVQK